MLLADLQLDTITIRTLHYLCTHCGKEASHHPADVAYHPAPRALSA